MAKPRIRWVRCERCDGHGTEYIELGDGFRSVFPLAGRYEPVRCWGCGGKRGRWEMNESVKGERG